MKKVVSVLLVAVLCIGFVGCENADHNKEEKKQSVSENSENHSSVVSSDTSDVFSKNEEWLSQYIDLSEYIVEESDYKKEYTSQVERSYTFFDSVTIDGEELGFPYSYLDLSEKGWECMNSTEQIIDGSTPPTETSSLLIFNYKGISPDFENADGRRIGTQFYNLTSTDKTVKECTGVGVRLYYGIDHRESPDFKLGAITKDTKLKGIISAIGDPSSIVCQENSECTMYFSQDEAKGSMWITYNNEGEMVSLSYKIEQVK